MNKDNTEKINSMERGYQNEEKMITPKGCLKEWELDVRPLVCSSIWLQNHGLEKNGLSLHQILPPIGFKFPDKTDVTENKTDFSSYGRGCFSLMLLPDGNTFNIAFSKDKLYHLEKQLLEAIYLFRRRIEWLTTESRRTFGVIEEKSVTIVLNFCSMSTQQFNQYMTALENVLRQQVSQISRFNLIRASEDMELYCSESIPVSYEAIENAVRWIWNLDRLAPVSNTAAVEAVLRALSDKHNEAVYLYTEGSSVDSGREILKHKVNEVCCLRDSIPVHVVSFNCDCSNTIRFLREFAESSNGRFHAYAVIMDVDAYETRSADGTTSRANVILKRKTLGGVPPGAGVRQDVALIFEEMEQARSNLEQIHQLRERSPVLTVTSNSTKGEEVDSTKENNIKEEPYMSSKEWLQSNGFEAKGLAWQDIVSNLAFRHTDTVIDLMHPPATETQRDAVVEQKLVNASYCDELFPVVKFKDGRVFHVQVTTDFYRNYEEKVHRMIKGIQKRIDWLNTGSRALFGTLVEAQIYILIDTSASMENSFGFVKQKILILMQEQLRYKRKLNIIAFNSKAFAWKDKIVDVSEHSLKSAWSWIQSLSCSGSTNTLAAIQLAMIDSQVEAIYLLTDGRPDQPPSLIISQLKMQKNIPIHTISFNCNDTEANNFLYDLAKATGGRYHCFSEKGHSLNQPEAWESMDIKDLKLEINHGLKNLNELLKLRDESIRLMWKKGTDEIKKSATNFREVEKCTNTSDNNKVSESTTNIARRNHYKLHSLYYKRPSTAPSKLSILTGSGHTQEVLDQPSTNQGYWSVRQDDQSARYQQAQKSITKSFSGHKRNRYYHTRTSSGRFSAGEWMLPETKKLFKKQADKKREIAGKTSKSQLRTQTSQQNKFPKFSSKIQNVTDCDVEKAEKLSSKQWLAKHGLEAKRLNILDALECTFVSHSAKYVPILDKYITGKVFNEIMPMAFVSGDSKMYFFNPGGINLKEYENKVRTAVDKIKEYLNTIVWNALPWSVKKEFDFEGPLSFEKNQVDILQLLKEADWPVAEDEISKLLDEIAKGEKFISQSKTLRKAAANRKIDSNEVKNHVPAPDSSHASSHRSRSADSSVSSDLKSQENGENSPRKSKPVSPSSHNDQFENSGAGEAKDQDKYISISRSRSHSSVGRKSPSNHTARSNNPKETEAKLSLSSSSSSSRSSSSSSNNSNKSLKSSNAQRLSLKEDTLPGAVKKNMRTVELSITRHGFRPKNLKRTVSRSKKSYSGSRSNLITKRDHSVKQEDISSHKKDPETLRPKLKDAQKMHNQQMKTQEQVRSLQNDQGLVTKRSRIKKGKVHIKLKALKGQKVIAKRDDDGLYYPAVVLRCPDPQHCIVHFEWDDKQVLTKSVLPHGGAVPCPPLYVGDYVLVKVIRLDTMRECFVPGIIQAVPLYHSDDKFYTVIMYNGQKSTTKRRYLVKISRNQFHADCVYISSHQNDNDNEPQTISSQQNRHRSRRERPDDRKKHTRPRSFPGMDVKRLPSRSQSSSCESNNSQDRSYVQEKSRTERSNSSSNSRSPQSSRSSKKVLSHRSLRTDSSSEREEYQKGKEPAALNKEHDENAKLEKRTSEIESTTGSEKDSSQSSWWLHEQRMSLQKQASLSKGEHVLARWSDDGWYYKGLVIHYYGNSSYEVQDSSGYTEQIWREDILQENKKLSRAFEINDHVIALHSKYNFSYAPGIIVDINDKVMTIKFYDNQVCSAEHQEVYHIAYQKYKLDVKYIKRKEDQLVQSAVVARCEEAYTYFPGTVVAKHADGKEYDIQWANGTRSSQQVIHIFGAFSRRPKIHLHSRVLACSDPVLLLFLPGTITNCQENSFSIKFYDGTRKVFMLIEHVCDVSLIVIVMDIQDKVQPDKCFWISESYYYEAIKFCKQHSV